MPATSPNICVVMAAMNAQDTITKAVASALAQAPVSEVIVVDDASSDQTADAALQADDGTGRLRVVSLPMNHGPAGARNHALSLSNSEYFCILDADDYMLPGRLERLLARGGDDWDLLADDIFILPSSLAGSIPEAEQFSAAGTDVMIIDLPTFVRGNISDRSRPRGELGFLKPIVRRSFLNAHNLRYQETLRLGEDYALYVGALRAGARFKVVGACGYIAIERSDSISSRHSATDLHRLADVDLMYLKNRAGLSADTLHAFAEHHHHVRNKAHHVHALEMKRHRGFLAGTMTALKSPSALPYILGQSLFPSHRPVSDPRGRFLIGSDRFAEAR